MQKNWCCILSIYFFYMYLIVFFFTACSVLGYDKFSALTKFIYSVCCEIMWCKSLILKTVKFSFLLMRNQYLMENSLIVLNLLFGMNSVSLISILFGMHYLIVVLFWNEFTDKFQEPASLSMNIFRPCKEVFSKIAQEIYCPP